MEAKAACRLCVCTSFVLQMFSKIGPQALPGTAFQGIIPEIPQQKKPLILAINTRFLFLSHLSHPLASCVPILGIRALTSTALSWQEELKQLARVVLSPCTAARCQGVFSDVLLPYGSQMVGWVFCTPGPVTHCLLPHSALKGIICISGVLGTLQGSARALTRLSSA